MSERFKNREEVLDKVEWEGGYFDALEYGLKTTDMPEGDDELISAWQAMQDAHTVFTVARNKVDNLLDPSE